MTHPYRSQPARAFWSSGVSGGFDAADLIEAAEPTILPEDMVVSAGSCFAANMVPFLESAGLRYLRTEQPHPAFCDLPENLGYRNFSAAYGNIYTARQLRQLLDRALGRFQPLEDRWRVDDRVVDPFRPGLRFPARSDDEFDALTDQHLRAVREALISATVFVFTLGLTEAWESVADGAVYPACPGTVSGTFDPRRHRFRNFTMAEVRDDLLAFLDVLRQINPGVRLLLTVSPVPLVATATSDHVLTATTYSKAVLRAAAGEVVSARDHVSYFPAYEIVTGPQAPEDYFEPDRRHVSEHGVAAVMRALLKHCGTRQLASRSPAAATQPDASPTTRAEPASPARHLSDAVAIADCDEALADPAYGTLPPPPSVGTPTRESDEN